MNDNRYSKRQKPTKVAQFLCNRRNIGSKITTKSWKANTQASNICDVRLYVPSPRIVLSWIGFPHTGTGAKLAAITHRHHLLIFEDRKFADIGFTVQLQYAGGDYRIVQWAHIINVHVLPGPDVIRALKETADSWKNSGGSKTVENITPEPSMAHIAEPPSERAALLLAQMSSSGNFLDAAYTKKCVPIGRKYRDFVMGFIALEPQNSEPDDSFLVMTPGCSLTPEESLDKSEVVPGMNDALGQQYVSPQELILRGCDISLLGQEFAMLRTLE
ncbi:hypothetical protein HYFRA_00004663 [Hymenoscyphus fraxineus]|uniref:Orotidine 5'-phosphate decarboxylase n=1 Tax=Hymenoscyphus fraxineus TaxID=746836 RepID=A0A9N9KXR9_9HELO|nr:hypothetical protein HYFRA_00004663 [Hymenoscyphus fraxineus]